MSPFPNYNFSYPIDLRIWKSLIYVTVPQLQFLVPDWFANLKKFDLCHRSPITISRARLICEFDSIELCHRSPITISRTRLICEFDSIELCVTVPQLTISRTRLICEFDSIELCHRSPTTISRPDWFENLKFWNMSPNPINNFPTDWFANLIHWIKSPFPNYNFPTRLIWEFKIFKYVTKPPLTISRPDWFENLKFLNMSPNPY